MYHQQVEASQLMVPITEKTVTKEQYIHILKVFYSYFSAIEKKVDQMAEELKHYLPDIASRRKTDWIRIDLEHLHASIPEGTTSIPVIVTVAQALGALYVMEGSTLGARFISATLKEVLAVDASNGALFFNGYGAETGAKWALFKQALTDYSTDRQKEDEVISSANETFAKFHDWILQAV